VWPFALILNLFLFSVVDSDSVDNLPPRSVIRNYGSRSGSSSSIFFDKNFRKRLIFLYTKMSMQDQDPAESLMNWPSGSVIQDLPKNFTNPRPVFFYSDGLLVLIMGLYLCVSI
jgi:hypothetical protein